MEWPQGGERIRGKANIIAFRHPHVHPKYVQELLGHASITLTHETYSHALPGIAGGAASAMDEALS